MLKNLLHVDKTLGENLAQKQVDLLREIRARTIPANRNFAIHFNKGRISNYSFLLE